jgi:hypothetical protein
LGKFSGQEVYDGRIELDIDSWLSLRSSCNATFQVQHFHEEANFGSTKDVPGSSLSTPNFDRLAIG